MVYGDVLFIMRYIYNSRVISSLMTSAQNEPLCEF